MGGPALVSSMLLRPAETQVIRAKPASGEQPVQIHHPRSDTANLLIYRADGRQGQQCIFFCMNNQGAQSITTHRRSRHPGCR